MRRTTHILSGILLVLLATGCGANKNTAASRFYHETKVKYNIFFNGDVAFIEGQKAIIQANEDDYTDVLNLYPVSNHRAAEASAGQMDRTIEKCRKSIKLHSIKTKPKPNPKRRSDPKYKAWLQQEEFNRQIARAWIRLGEAEFHKGDFLGSVGTFTYILNHYSYDPDMVAQCQLWIARAYGELGWMYEADDMLHKVNMDNLKRKHAKLYSSVSADVLMKAGQYHEAIPFIKLAMPEEKRKVNRPRFAYVLGQLYEREGNKKEAITYYTKCIRMTPPVIMDFNARLRRAELGGKNSIKRLKSMTKQSKYKDKLDQIYASMGNIMLQHRDTAQALKYYAEAIDKATGGGMTKADVLIRAADIHYEQRHYAQAQPYYREAVTILPNEHKDYARVQKRSETLDGLVREYGVVVLQDSLQGLSKLSEEEQRAVAEKVVMELIRAEKQAEADAKQAARDAELDMDRPLSVDTRNMIGGGGQSTDWYFYNPQLLRSGKQDFQRRWGNRTLEDNWRRLSKTATATPLADVNTDELAPITDSITTDSLAIADKPAPVTDVHSPEYYLQQIPKTPADFQLSDSLIADALYNLIYIYKDEVGDKAEADRTFEELCSRYPADKRLVDLYYMQYLTALRDSDDQAMSHYRERLTTLYPYSKQAEIVSDPLYFERLKRMTASQDSLFEQTYNAFAKSQFKQVKANKKLAEKDYPLSPLMPRFLFLNAIAVARTDGQQAFIGELRDMVNRYPENELSAMAKDFLAMMGQGMESKKGAMDNTLNEQRGIIPETVDTTAAEQTFSAETAGATVVLLILPEPDEQALNNLLYQVALFNFSQFLIRDFELRPMPVFGGGAALRVNGFDSIEEAKWYMGLMDKNPELQLELRSLRVSDIIPITEENMKLLNTKYTLEDYKAFLK